ncbi:MAG: YdcF family protein [Anaerolineales bacterium]
MDRLVEAVKDYLIPGSTTFLMIGLSFGTFLLFGSPRLSRWGRWCLSLLAAGYWLMSVPAFARALERGLNPGFGPLAGPDHAGDAQAIVVLGGGTRSYRSADGTIHSLSGESAARALEAARLHRLLGGLPVIASGGYQEAEPGAPESEALAHALRDLGIPEDRILEESRSQDTRQQALAMARLLSDLGIDRFVLVTSPEHMARAVAAFRKAGLDPIASVARQGPQDEETPPGSGLLPGESGLAVGRGALREYMALLYYWARGWLEFR